MSQNHSTSPVARQSPSAEPIGVSSVSQALLVCVLWGGNIVALKFSLEAFPPFWVAWWRFSVGVLVIIGWCLLRGLPLKPRAGEWRPLALLSALFASQIVLLNLGVSLTSPAYAVVLINAHPIFANLIGHFVPYEERLNRMRILGLALACGGVAYLASGRPVESLAPNPILGNLLMVGSAFLLGVRSIYTRWLVQGTHPVRAVSWQVLLSLPVFLVLGLAFEPMLRGPLTTKPLLALAYQSVIVAGCCFLIWTYLLKRHSAGDISMYTFSVPFFGILLSALMFSEPVTLRILLAAALVTAGIIIVTRHGSGSKN